MQNALLARRLCFLLFFFAVFVRTDLGRAFAAAAFGVGAADAFFSALFRPNEIKQSGAYYHRDSDNDNYILHFDLRAFCSLFFLMIREARITAIKRTIAQPSKGIQPSPNEPPVISVPKKNTKKATV